LQLCEHRLKEDAVNRSLSISARLVTIALASVLSAETVVSAQTSAPAKMSITATTNQKQPHRLAVQVNVNDPAVMTLALNNVSN
jgi:hypothetical protein